ncbi:MAG: ArsB/NhaD family transporter [Polyangiaceae bacterium]
MSDMLVIAAYSSLAVTLGLVVARPRVSEKIRIGPGPAAAVGVLIMLAAGVVQIADVSRAATILWRPLLAIVSIMVTTAVAQQVGLLDRVATMLFARTNGSATRVFFRIFFLSAITAAALNNDSAVLLLTPAVIGLVRRRYPKNRELVVPFSFAVFMAAGVAPLVLSNPMNMIFAAYAKIDFNAYAIRMTPIALVGWAVAAWALYRVFKKPLTLAPETEGVTDEGLANHEARSHENRSGQLDLPQRRMIAVLALVLGTCPFVAYFGGNVWMVAIAGAAFALLFVARPANVPIVETIRLGISWEIVAFLILVSVMGVGMRNAGLVARLTHLYAGGNVAIIGGIAALGSATLNNHPMSILNMLALEGNPAKSSALAALIGGDLGPRLLPMGSLAGLLWYDKLRKENVDVPLFTFMRVGLAITIPTLAISLALLWLF